MNINFGQGFGFSEINFEMMQLHIEVRLGNTIIQSQTLQMPYRIMMQQCQNLVNEIANSDQPMKITMTGEKILDLPNGDSKAFPSKLIYANNAYTANFDIEG